MKATRWALGVILGLSLVELASAQAASGDNVASTRPAQVDTSFALADPQALVLRLRTAIDAVGLTEKQHERVSQILSEAQQEAQDLDERIQELAPRQRIEEVTPFIQGLRQQLGSVLTSQQLAMLQNRMASAGALEMFLRIQRDLEQLDLTTTQHNEIDQLIAETREKGNELRKMREQGEDVRAEARDLVTNFRQQLFEILTPEQGDKLRDMLNPPGPGNPRVTQAADADSGRAKAPANAPAPDETPTNADAPVAMTALAPDFRLGTPDGLAIDLSKYKGRVVVLEFGSVTCPSFRDHAAAMEQLKEKYESQAAFLLIYTSEAHPADGFQITRNEQDGVAVNQPKDLAARRDLAKRSVAALHITFMTLVDGMDDAVAKAYGGFPNATVVIAPDGTIAGRQQWNDPSGLARMIEAAEK
jgi:thiol-disulfide isomerase/thioredoxin